MKRYACDSDGRPYQIDDGEFVRYEDAQSWGSKKVQKLLDDYEATRAINVRLQAEVDAMGRYDPEQPAYTLDQAVNLAGLWRAGKLIGGDASEVCFALLAELERLAAPVSAQEAQGAAYDRALEAHARTIHPGVPVIPQSAQEGPSAPIEDISHWWRCGECRACNCPERWPTKCPVCKTARPAPPEAAPK